MPLNCEQLRKEIVGVQEYVACHSLPCLRHKAPEAEAAQVRALLFKIQDATISTPDISALVLILQSGPWSEESKKSLCEAVTGKVEESTVATPGHNRCQEFHDLPRYATESLLRILESSVVDRDDGKLPQLATFLYSLGVIWPSPQTIKSAVGFLLTVSKSVADGPTSRSLAKKLAKDIKNIKGRLSLQW